MQANLVAADEDYQHRPSAVRLRFIGQFVKRPPVAGEGFRPPACLVHVAAGFFVRQFCQTARSLPSMTPLPETVILGGIFREQQRAGMPVVAPVRAALEHRAVRQWKSIPLYNVSAPVRKVFPPGNTTCPPPCAAQASNAFWTAAVSLFVPSPLRAEVENIENSGVRRETANCRAEPARKAPLTRRMRPFTPRIEAGLF